MNTQTSILLNQVPIVWNLEKGEFSFFGIPAVLFWANPSLYRMLAPLCEELGADLFRLLIAHSSSFGTDEDYHAMVTQLGSHFAEGFLAWGSAVSAAGWGVFELPVFQPETSNALVRVRNPWELRMQQSSPRIWGCPFLKGKIIGIFSHAFRRPVWAAERTVPDAEEPYVEFTVAPSERTIEGELNSLRAKMLQKRQEELYKRIEEAHAALLDKASEVQQKELVIRRISEPIIEVWKGVLVVPISIELSGERAERLKLNVLSRVVSMRARHVILDLTGLTHVDTATCAQISSIVSSIRLLGSESTVVGIAPAMAATTIELDVSFGGARTLRTLASALREVVGLSEQGAPSNAHAKHKKQYRKQK